MQTKDDETITLLPTAPPPSPNTVMSSDDDVVVSEKSKRLVSLDAFRGLTICFMIIVHKTSGSVHLLSHADWNGLTIAVCCILTSSSPDDNQ
jgi:hypothetical protein